MANEKKMCQIQQTYESEKGKPGFTLSKVCKEQNVKVSEFVDWLQSMQKPVIKEVQITECTEPGQCSESFITIAVNLRLPNGLHLQHDGLGLKELSDLVSKLDSLC